MQCRRIKNNTCILAHTHNKGQGTEHIAACFRIRDRMLGRSSWAGARGHVLMQSNSQFVFSLQSARAKHMVSVVLALELLQF